MRRRLRQVQVSGPGSVNIQVGGDLKGKPPETPWWCDCDDMVGPHVHCVWGGRGAHVHAVELPPDHREHRKRGSRG
jgi:hypothetical protein